MYEPLDRKINYECKKSGDIIIEHDTQSAVYTIVNIANWIRLPNIKDPKEYKQLKNLKNIQNRLGNN
jgi:hypothetical protein